MDNSRQIAACNSCGPDIVIDAALLLFAAWSEFGYAAFSSSAVSESILDPLERYLYSGISNHDAHEITNILNILSKVFAIADACLTVATILDIRSKRARFQAELARGIDQLRIGEIGLSVFLLNSLIFSFSFMVISFAPWAGLRMQKFDHVLCTSAGISMLVGQLVVLSMQNAKYIFSTPGSIKFFHNLPLSEKKIILGNLFGSRKGWGLVLRSVFNAMTKAIRFYGVGSFTNKYIFNNPRFGYYYSATAAAAVSYRIFATQSVNDYKAIFGSSEEGGSTQSDEGAGRQANETNSGCMSGLFFVLAILVGIVFCLRTFSTPVLYTGPVDDPRSNYDVKDTILASFGLLFGAFSSYQYSRYMWGLGHEAIVNTAGKLFTRSQNVGQLPAGSEADESARLLVQ